MSIDNYHIPQLNQTFNIYKEAQAFIEHYAIQNNIVLISEYITRNSEQGIIKAAIICEKSGIYRGSKIYYKTKKTMYLFKIFINYRKHTKLFIYTYIYLEHNHILTPDILKFSPNIRKLDLYKLSQIKQIYNSNIRTKDIVSIISIISNKYIYKKDIYNTVTRQR